MLSLNLPKTDIRLQKKGETLYIWDHLRTRWIVLTPEEWVRQNFTHWMVECLGYPAARLGHEISLEVNGMKRRCDAVFYDQNGQPQIICEFKAPHINITQKTFDQISRYNLVMRVPLLIVSNGNQHFCCHMDYENQSYEFLTEIPKYQ